jgi:MFS-type transporter involved in bile tolerance (Atg22 family)
MQLSKGMKSSEFIVTIAAIGAVSIPVLLERVPADSTLGVILAALLPACLYVAGRTWIKGRQPIEPPKQGE